MEVYNLYDVGAEIISSKFKKTPLEVKSVLIALDPLNPTRAYKKLSNLLVRTVVPRTNYIS